MKGDRGSSYAGGLRAIVLPSEKVTPIVIQQSGIPFERSLTFTHIILFFRVPPIVPGHFPCPGEFTLKEYGLIRINRSGSQGMS